MESWCSTEKYKHKNSVYWESAANRGCWHYKTIFCIPLQQQSRLFVYRPTSSVFRICLNAPMAFLCTAKDLLWFCLCPFCCFFCISLLFFFLQTCRLMQSVQWLFDRMCLLHLWQCKLPVQLRSAVVWRISLSSLCTETIHNHLREDGLCVHHPPGHHPTFQLEKSSAWCCWVARIVSGSRKHPCFTAVSLLTRHLPYWACVGCSGWSGTLACSCPRRICEFHTTQGAEIGKKSASLNQ